MGTVTVVANNTGQSNCSSDPTALQVSISGTNGVPSQEADAHGLSVFPNPGRDRVTLRMAEAPAPDAQLEVLDAWGRVLRLEPVRGASTPLDLGALPPGCYTVRVQDGDRLWRARWVKE